MLKSKKFWLAVIFIIVTNIGTAVGCMYWARAVNVQHRLSVMYEYNAKIKLLLSAISNEIKKDPAAAVAKIEKLQQQLPNSCERSRTKEELEKAGSK
jgi:Txe/YoeB family toxin of Txe-Axe toxin-antitoxin module